ncbi:MAG: SulP family inorganic anion transporter [Phycisphaerales bacterium]
MRSEAAQPISTTGIERWLPVVALARRYQARWLVRDVVAGVILTAMLVPVGMGYAQASGLPAIQGLYATIVPLLAYAVFGPSRVMVLGPDSSLCALIAAAIVPLAANDPSRATALAGALSILAGGLCLLAGLARAGFVADLFSKPIRFGFLNGIAVSVLIGQLPKLTGATSSGDNVPQQAIAFARAAAHGGVHAPTLAIGASCLALILAMRRWTPRIPGVLVAVVGATVVVAVLDLAASAGVSAIGELPHGLPDFEIPRASPSEWGALWSAALAIALVSFADTSVLSRTLAKRDDRAVDGNQELVALGAANIAGGLFQGFPISSSSSRTPVAVSVGAQSQLACVVGALCIAALLMFAPALLTNLPNAALAAIVIASCLSLFEIDGVARLYRLRRGEFALSLICTAGVIVLGNLQGIFIAVGIALLAFVWRAWHPYDAVLGRVDGLKGYHDIARHPDARRIPGLVLFRWDAPLFFANAEIFHEHVRRAIDDAPTPTKWVVVAAEPVTDIDTTAADMLVTLDRELHARGMDLCFAEMKGPVKDHLRRYGLFTHLGEENFFRTVGQAVDRYVELHKVEWVDWDESPAAR